MYGHAAANIDQTLLYAFAPTHALSELVARCSQGYSVQGRVNLGRAVDFHNTIALIDADCVSSDTLTQFRGKHAKRSGQFLQSHDGLI